MSWNRSIQSISNLPKTVTHKRESILTLTIFLVTYGTGLLRGQQITPSPQTISPAPQTAAPSLPKPAPAFYRNLIVIDPAHGGSDSGAQLSNSAVEKDLTLSFAQKLRPSIAGQGFTVVMTRDSDPSDELTPDARAGVANHVRPLACIVIHATASGSGVHVVSSSLPQTDSKSSARALPWNRAQEPAVAMSIKLANEVGLALESAHIPVLLLRASIPPIDNLICPAIAVELAPLKDDSGKMLPASDSSYQQRAITAIAAGVASFRAQNAPAPTQGTGGRGGASQ